jgi:hypothetical protein
MRNDQSSMSNECPPEADHLIDKSFVSDLVIRNWLFRAERVMGASVNGKPPVSKTGTGGSTPPAPGYLSVR